MSLTTPLTRLVREAIRLLPEPQWRVHGVGALRRHDNGYWAQIVFARANRNEEPLEVGLTAGVLSPYLLRVVNRQDPDHVPRAAFVAAHASVVWDQRVVFTRNSVTSTPPFTMPDRQHPRTVIVGLDDGEAWMTNGLRTLAIATWGHAPGAGDRQTTYPQDWSHERFLRFLNEAPE